MRTIFTYAVVLSMVSTASLDDMLERPLHTRECQGISRDLGGTYKRAVVQAPQPEVMAKKMQGLNDWVNKSI